MTKVAFEVDLTSGKVRDVRATAEAGPLRDTFTWSVTYVEGAVRVFALGHRGLEAIARCTVDAAGVVSERVGAGDDEPNDYQWGRIVDGLGVALGRKLTIDGTPRKDRRLREQDAGPRRPAAARPAIPQIAPVPSPTPGPSLSRVVGVVVAATTLLAIGVWFIVLRDERARRTATPPPPVAPVAPIAASEPGATAVADAAAIIDAPPPLEEAVLTAPSVAAAAAVIRDRLDEGAVADGAWLLARYASGRAAWADFHVAEPETSLPLALKDGAAERGKRLCVTGRLLDIARTDLDRRPVYAGALVTADGDTLRFVAVGSTGTLVKRDTGTFCGVVTGRVDDAAMAVGMFDLPENARPIVER